MIQRMAYICKHCEGVYADQPVTQCDCLNGTGADFYEGTITYQKGEYSCCGSFERDENTAGGLICCGRYEPN